MGRSGRLTVLCQDVLFPPTHGGRAETWHLVRGLRAHGIDLQLACWTEHGERIAPDDMRGLRQVASDVVEVPRRTGIRRFMSLRYPPKMLAWVPTLNEYIRLLQRVSDYRPDWILFDSWPGYLTGLRVSQALGVPLLYRSCNIEYLYFQHLYSTATGRMKLQLGLNALRMNALECRIRRSVDLVLDISESDAAHWRERGDGGRSIVASPVWTQPHHARSQVIRDIDVLFVGNLRTPNNRAGLAWFTERVVSALQAGGAGMPRIVFAGSSPDPAAVAAWMNQGVECIANPVDVAPLYARAKVLINPLQTGFGVNVKMIEILANGARAVSTNAGATGLPGAIRSLFGITDDPVEFAAMIRRELATPTDDSPQDERRQLFDKVFGPATLGPLIQEMYRLSAAKRAAPPGPAHAPIPNSPALD